MDHAAQRDSLPVRQFRLFLAEREIVFGSADVRYEFVCDTAGSARMVGTAQGARHAGGYAMRMTGRFVPATDGMRDFTQMLRAQRVGDHPTRASK